MASDRVPTLSHAIEDLQRLMTARGDLGYILVIRCKDGEPIVVTKGDTRGMRHQVNAALSPTGYG